MHINEYICDECNKKRSGDANNWWNLIEDDRELRVRHFQYAYYDGADVCGQDCAVKVFSRWLSTGKLKAEVPNVKS